jgi:hypothetical protein
MKKLLLSVLSLCFVATGLYGQEFKKMLSREMPSREMSKMAQASESDELKWLTNAVESGRYYSFGAGQKASFGAVAGLQTDKLFDYDGLQVSVIGVAVSETVSDVTIFVMKGSSAATATEVASKKVDALSGGWNYVKLDAPLTIDASENLYVGYKMDVQESSYPAMFDASGLDDSETEMSFAYLNGEYIDLATEPNFSDLGHPMIQVLVGGDESKLETVTFLSSSIFKYWPKGSEVIPNIQFVNNSFGSVESVTVDYSVNGVTDTEKLEFSTPVGPNSLNIMSMPLPAITITDDVDFSYVVTHVNDKPILQSEENYQFYAYDKQEAVERTLLMEKFYSQFCGYSPQGKEAIDEAIVGYEDRVARIYHHAGYRADLFTIDESVETAAEFGVNYSPGTMGDRMWFDALGSNAFNAMQWTGDLIADFLQQDGLASLKISDSYDVETRELTVNVSGNCIVTPDNKKITVAVTHSNYSSFQKNAQNYMHDHFPILYLTAAGGDDLQVNTDGSYDMTFKGVVPVSYNNGNGTIVTGNKVTINLDELRIVAFISDSWDGADNDRYVLNSATKEAATVGASVAEVELAGVNVYGTDSRIVVEGDYDTVKVFNASGMETGTEGLSAGLYIVKVTVDGQSMVKKVAVK